MKKVLAFVLVLAMVLGSVSMAFAATYPDDAAITNKEAVGLLSGLKVLEGDANGFRPNDTLTRAEAAAIIARLKLGRDDADKLSAAAAPFTDVPANHWAAGYINYCVSDGILAGNGDGTFSPDGLLTVTAFGKMLLVCLGYDPLIEGLVGSNWESNVAKTMVTAGISISASGAITRDNAALLCLKALEAKTVKYANKGVTVNVGGTSVTTGGSAAENIPATAANNYLVAPLVNDAWEQLAEKLYQGKLTKGTNTDEFGNPSSVWSYTDKVAGKYVGEIGKFAKTAVATFTAKTSAADVASQLSGYQVQVAGDYKSINNTTKYGATSVTAIDLTVDAGAPNVNIDIDEAAGTADKTLAKMIADYTANGKLVNLFADKGEITDIVVVNYTVAKVTGVTTNKTSTKYALDNVAGDYRVYTDGTANTAILAGSVAKDDYVTVFKTGTKAYIYPTTKATGNQTAYSTKDGVTTITVDGSNYTVAAATYAPYDGQANGDDVTIYLDQYGYAVYGKGTSSSNYAYIINVTTKSSTTLDGATGSAQVRVILEDGTLGDYDLATHKVTASENASGVYAGLGTGNYAVKNLGMLATAASALKGNVVTYKVSGTTFTVEKSEAMINAAGTTTVDAITNTTVTAGQTGYGLAGGGTVAANASTKFVAYNNDKNTAVGYEGATNVPKITTTIDAIKAVFTASNSINTAKVIFVNAEGGTAAATATYAYVNAKEETTSKSGDDTVYTYVAYDKAGDKIEVTRKNSKITPSGIYEISSANAYSGTVTYGAPNEFRSSTTSSAVKVNGSILEVDGTYYTITDSTVTVFVDSKAGEVKDHSVHFVLSTDKNHESEVIVIYVVDHTAEED